MSCYEQCPSTSCSPILLANSYSEPCVRQCQDSRVVIQLSPVVVTLPGPILSSFPQNTAVGSSASAAVGSILSVKGVPISSGSSLGFGSFGYPGLGSGYSWPYHCYNTYRSGFYGLCQSMRSKQEEMTRNAEAQLMQDLAYGHGFQK